MTFVRRHPLASFFAIAYGLTWAGWVPLALAGVRIYPGSSTTHVPGLLGPALAAFIVTSATEGKAGVSALIRRLFLVTRPRVRFLVRTMTLPMILGGFVLGIAAGAVVLAEVTSRTGGSVLAAALWHTAYNLTSATAAGRGIVAAVTTTCVMIWSVALLSRGALRARRDRGASVFSIGSAAGSKSGKEELCQSPQQIR